MTSNTEVSIKDNVKRLALQLLHWMINSLPCPGLPVSSSWLNASMQFEHDEKIQLIARKVQTCLFLPGWSWERFNYMLLNRLLPASVWVIMFRNDGLEFWRKISQLTGWLTIWNCRNCAKNTTHGNISSVLSSLVRVTATNNMGMFSFVYLTETWQLPPIAPRRLPLPFKLFTIPLPDCYPS